MTVRPYRPEDRPACLALFDSNVGGAFRAEERDDFAFYLDHAAGPYFVMEADGGVVACGGWAPETEAGLAAVCWTMVDRSRHGRGLGRTLHCRILADAEAAGRTSFRLETIPETAPFFARLGFEIVAEEPDGYGPGLPRVEMRR